ncbi:MAG: hypothetical protein JSS00_03570 [Proteobacteria bacterium]|nr:hypothetical protein [Pseudomonadota bacterium]
MRLLVILLIGGFLGWIAGSLYPAPHAWLEALHLDAIEQRLNNNAAPATSAGTTTATTATTTAASAAAAGAAPPAAQAASHSASRGPVDQQTLNQYRAWISQARAQYPYADSEERMYAVMMCESRGQAGLVNSTGPYSGLFQYSSAAWNGAWNTYRAQSVLDPRAQIFATALAWQRHMQGQWGCYRTAH